MFVGVGGMVFLQGVGARFVLAMVGECDLHLPTRSLDNL